MNKKRKHRGFTLIEVLLVLAILGMLAGVAVFAYSGQQRGARIDATKLKIKSLGEVLNAYNFNIGHYPTEEEGGLEALRTKPSFSEEKLGANWRGPYVNSGDDLIDVWGNKFNYKPATPGSSEAAQVPYILSSNGPDK